MGRNEWDMDPGEYLTPDGKRRSRVVDKVAQDQRLDDRKHKEANEVMPPSKPGGTRTFQSEIPWQTSISPEDKADEAVRKAIEDARKVAEIQKKPIR